MAKDEGNFVSVAGKISTWSYGRIMRILKRRGLNIYQMIQNFCDIIIRCMDDRHNLTPEMERAMSIFEHMEGWRDALNIADPSVRKIVGEAIYFLFDEYGKKKGCRAVHVTKPFFGHWSEDMNVQQILERFMDLTFPSLYRRLRFIAVCRECTSILELLIDIVGELEREEDKKELLRDFEDADRGDFGQHIHTDRNRKRPYEASQDTLFKDELI